MSTTLLASVQELSKQLGDSWQSTTTGAGSATTLVDAALLAKANDWITDNTWAFLTEEPAGNAAIYDERKVSSLVNSTGTLTTLTFAAAPGTGIDYEVHRLFSPSEKRTAIIAAARRSFPDINLPISDTSKAVNTTDYSTAIDITTLGFQRNTPHQVFETPDKTAVNPVWSKVRGYDITPDGEIVLQYAHCGYDLKLVGIGLANFTKASAVSTDWDAVIAIDQPQLDILVAEAALYLYTQLSLPNFETGTRNQYQNMIGFWEKESSDRRARNGMSSPATTVDWGTNNTTSWGVR